MTIDPGALQRNLDETAASLLVPGAMVIVQTPSGTHRLSYGTTTLGEAVPPTSATSFRIGSVTKTMTAAVVLQLVEEGKVALDDPIGSYLAGVPEGDVITIAQLLEMRSGLHNYLDTAGFESTYAADPTHIWAPQDLLDLGFAEPMSFEPGGGYDYSNTNTILLGVLAEQIEGRSLATIMAERLFEPLGMDDTSLPDATTVTLPDPSSRGYQYGPLRVSDATLTADEQAAAEAGTLQPNDVTVQSPSWSWAAGGVVSTADDLLTWIRALNRGEVLDEPTQQLQNDSIQVMHPEDPKARYGYGIAQIRFGEVRLTYHEGQLSGFNTMAIDDDANDVSIIVWTNRAVDHDRDIAFSVAANLLGDIYRTPASTPPADDRPEAPASGAIEGAAGELVDIGGGRSMYLECRGDGSPTVMLIAGTGNAGDVWQHVAPDGDPSRPLVASDAAVYPTTARSTRVCTYDRPDTLRDDGSPGRSSPVVQPTSTSGDVADLHAMLTSAGVPAPYVLVGHSLGALLATTFARTHPDDVVGLVLVDPASQYMETAMGPDAWHKYVQAALAQGATGTESIDPDAANTAINELPPLPPVPVVVLSSDKPWFILPFGADGELVDYSSALMESHALLAASLGATRITTTGSAHHIHLENPALVNQQICAVIAETGSGRCRPA